MGMVSYTLETLPPVSQEELDRVNAIKDEDIDFSDIPEITGLSGLRPRSDWGLYKSVDMSGSSVAERS